MPTKISARLLEIIDALPIREGMRVLEIGCGPGAAAREIVNRFKKVQVMAIDRSATAILQAKKNSKKEIEEGNLEFLQSKIETFSLTKGEKLFDIVFAVRVGALDGRHPEIAEMAFSRIRKLVKKNGRVFIDGGNPLKELRL